MEPEFQPDNETEFLISQYLDGMLDAEQRGTLARRIEQDPAMARLFEEYRALEQLTRQAAGAVPEVDWEVFAAGIERRRRAVERARVSRLRVIRVFAPLAAAAAAVAITFSLLYRTPLDRGTVVPGVEVVSRVEIARPSYPTPAPGDSFIAYSEEPDGSYAPELAAERVRPVIAMAAVGANVNWPADLRESDVPTTQ